MLRALSFKVQLLCLVGVLRFANASEASASSPSTVSKCLTMDTIYSGLKSMEYAVRGQVVIKADSISENIQDYPFDHIVYANIGNPQSVGQKPLTWPRQVLALVDLPNEIGIEHPAVEQMFPADAIRRARKIKEALPDGTGAYSHSKGARIFRRDVAAFMEERDGGLKADPEDIFLANGASAAINMVLTALIKDTQTGVMIPIPQYPIYSATIDLLRGHKVGYYLDEKNDWALDVQELERSLREAEEQGIDVVALVLINPGNPSGSVLTEQNLHDVVRFCSKHNLVLLADEVYQENVYDDNAKFISAKRAAYDCGFLDKDEIELFSFHSVSKGVFGECGRRGGYVECVGIVGDVKDQLYKLASSNLCSTLPGQVMTAIMARGPEPGDESYESHQKEMRDIFESLKRRSRIVSEGLDGIDGFSCKPAKGSMYCFPSVEMPKGAFTAAKQQGISPDTLYCLSLLERSGICVVPASGFGQRDGRFGFRTTFLPSEEEMARCVDEFRDHYAEFCQKYE